MPKRFTETGKWSDKWFRALSPSFKLAWLYILDNCDCAGVIELDEQLANFQIGCDVDWCDFWGACRGRIEPLKDGVYWVQKFIQFQQKGGLSTDSNVHYPILCALGKRDLLDRLPEGFVKGRRSLSEALKSAPGNSNSNSKGNSKSTSKGKSRGSVRGEAYSPEFLAFWDSYPRKEGKAEASKAFEKTLRDLDLSRPEALAKIAGAVAAQMDSLTDDLKFCPHPATWLNQRRYDDEPMVSPKSSRVATSEQLANWNATDGGLT